jgi:uncharacterized protein with NAD-binding domain and iron-sulfur cluster
MGDRPIRIAVVGGGCAGLTAAFELTRPSLSGKFDVTVFQSGWRLGGKGASGRGPSSRIEEHGLHLWMGYYENAFRLMRECYDELDRDESHPIAKWTDAFLPANFNIAADWSPQGQWLLWKVHFPPQPGLPGDPATRSWSVPEYMARAVALLRTLFETIRDPRAEQCAGPDARIDGLFEGVRNPEALSATLSRLIKQGALVGLAATGEVLRLLEVLLGAQSSYPQSTLLTLVEVADRALRNEPERLVERDDSLRRLWEIADIVLAVVRGSIRFRLAIDPRGFDAIDHYDSREWLELNGASQRAINSAFIRALYDLAFAYEEGSPDLPRFSAGAALRGAMRAFFTYRGAFFWKMAAGMGDVVFAPLYEVLTKRGVKFEFFHRLENVGLSTPDDRGERHVERLDFVVQARPSAGEYRPLVDVRGLPCWPSAPDLSQLELPEGLEQADWDPESQWDPHQLASKCLRVGADFDIVVLAVGLGTVPYVCRELIATDPSWAQMSQRLGAVATQAFQLWIEPTMSGLGWADAPTNLSGFVEPFDTWADMTHVARFEDWDRCPGAIAYFCNALPLPSDTVGKGLEFVRAQQARVRGNAARFLNQDIIHLWPGACSEPGAFRWNVLLGAGPHATEDALDSHFLTANVKPSDLYAQALPGTAQYRISPLDQAYDNLVVAGDWTHTGLNMGCVEAAVMSGKLAAHAISRSPSLADVTGFDHP